MSAQAGWYPDPSGNADKLRFWDGNQWTSEFMDAPASMQAASQSVSVSAHVQSEVNAQPTQPAAQQPAVQQPQSSYQSQPYQQAAQSYQQPNYSAPAPTATTTYAASSTDTTLRLIAFVFNILTIVAYVGIGIASFGIGLIPLVWMIPMTVMSWRVYQGRRTNTVALGVCTLLFVNIVSGILLLCSKKDA